MYGEKERRGDLEATRWEEMKNKIKSTTTTIKSKPKPPARAPLPWPQAAYTLRECDPFLSFLSKLL
jgi:hypothetical protein